MVDGESISPQSRAQYKVEYEHAADLFQQSLVGFQNSQEVHQKDQFKDVMAKAMVIMNETIKEALGKEGQKKQDKLHQDYQKFLANASPSTIDQLNKDITSLQKLVEG